MVTGSVRMPPTSITTDSGTSSDEHAGSTSLLSKRNTYRLPLANSHTHSVGRGANPSIENETTKHSGP